MTKTRPVFEVTAAALPAALYLSGETLRDLLDEALNERRIIDDYRRDGDEFQVSHDLRGLGWEEDDIEAFIAGNYDLGTTFAVLTKSGPGGSLRDSSVFIRLAA